MPSCLDLLDTATEASPVLAEINSAVSWSVQPKKQLRVTVSNDFLPQILRVSVLQSCEILEHTGHGDIPGAYYAEPAGEVGDRAARCQFFPKDMDRHRQFAASQLWSAYRTSLMKQKDRNSEARKSKVLSWSLVTRK